MPRKKDDLLKKQVSKAHTESASRKNTNTLQKRLIATRLMQISLLVDDYLYQQKPMSQRSASTYIQEISGFKDKCYQDVRSLQVIEKLTRCLKGIIHEQQELNGENFEGVFDHPSQHIPETTNIVLSPVYSTVDEDLTQYEEIDMDIRIRGEIQENGKNNNIEMNDRIKDVTTENDPLGDTNKVIETDMTKRVTGNSNDITQYDKYPLNTDLEVIDLCDYEIMELINQNHNLIEPDFNIQNAISHLSINDIEEALTPFSQDCSQSILNSYNTAGQQNSVDPLTNDYEDVITATIIHQKPATDIKSKITKIVLPKKISATEQKIQMPEELIAIESINKHRAQVPAKIDSIKALKPVPKKRIKNNGNTSKTAKARKAQIKPTKTVEKTPKQKAKVAKQKLNVEKSYTITQNPSQYEQFTTNLPYRSNIPLTNSNQLDTEPTGNKIQNKITDLPIYNSKIVNDLSWIENIRFVREIQSEECECFKEHETFWENYILPNNCSENDFNY